MHNANSERLWETLQPIHKSAQEHVCMYVCMSDWIFNNVPQDIG